MEDLNVRWKAGTRFLSLLKDSVFNLVPTRKAAKLVVKALKAGKNTVDLTGEASGPDDKTEENAWTFRASEVWSYFAFLKWNGYSEVDLYFCKDLYFWNETVTLK